MIKFLNRFRKLFTNITKEDEMKTKILVLMVMTLATFWLVPALAQDIPVVSNPDFLIREDDVSYSIFSRNEDLIATLGKSSRSSYTGGTSTSNIVCLPDVSPDGIYLIACYRTYYTQNYGYGYNQYIRVIDTDTGEIVRTIALRNSYRQPLPSADVVINVRFRPQAEHLIKVIYGEGTVFYNAETGDVVEEGPAITSDNLSVELRIIPEVISPTEPAYVHLYVRNSGSNEMRIHPDDGVHLSGGRFYISSISDGYVDITDAITSFHVDKDYSLTHISEGFPYEYIAPHSYACIKTFKLRHMIFGAGGQDQELEPGYYRIRLTGNLGGKHFFANAHYMVKESADNAEILQAVNRKAEEVKTVVRNNRAATIAATRRIVRNVVKAYYIETIKHLRNVARYTRSIIVEALRNIIRNNRNIIIDAINRQ